MHNIEKIIEQKFHSLKHELPGNQYKEIENIRKQALDKFLQQGMPGKHLEKWKYTDLKNIKTDFANDIYVARQSNNYEKQTQSDDNIISIVINNGEYQGKNGQIYPGIHIDNCANILEQPDHPYFSDVIAKINDNNLHNLARAFVANGFVLTIDPEIELGKIIHIDYQDQTQNHLKTLFVSNIITVKPKTKVTIVETNSEQKTSKIVNYYIQQRWRIAQEAECHHYSILQNTQEKATYIGFEDVDIADKGKYYSYTVTTGKGLLRSEKNINIRGEYVNTNYAVAHLLQGNARHNSYFEIRHHKPQSKSNAIAKAILSQNAVAVSQGKIYVAPYAQKTESYEMFSGLMLNKNSQYIAKPELEIYADDVVCGHGATISDLDLNSQFYLKSRGINAVNTRKILAKAYIKQVFDNIEQNIYELFIEKHIDKNLEQILKYPD